MTDHTDAVEPADARDAGDALAAAKRPRPTDVASREHGDLLQALAAHRGYLLVTAHGLTEEQARMAPTASALSIGGIIKHVMGTEQAWIRFLQGGADAMMAGGDGEAWEDRFRLRDDQTLAEVLEAYAETARTTASVLRSVTDFDAEHPLPEAPWFETGGRWSARRVVLHLIAETAQHAGHADIIRETIDGSRTMG